MKNIPRKVFNQTSSPRGWKPPPVPRNRNQPTGSAQSNDLPRELSVSHKNTSYTLGKPTIISIALAGAVMLASVVMVVFSLNRVAPPLNIPAYTTGQLGPSTNVHTLFTKPTIFTRPVLANPIITNNTTSTLQSGRVPLAPPLNSATQISSIVELYTKPVVWFALGGSPRPQSEFVVFASTNSQCVLYSRSSKLLAHIDHPIKAPLANKYLFTSPDDSFQMEIRNTGLSIEGEAGNISLVQLQNGCTNLVLVVAPLPLEQRMPGVLECALERPLLDLMAPYLDIRLALDVPVSGVTNISTRVQPLPGHTILNYTSMDFVRAWQSTWEKDRQSRARSLQRLQQDLPSSSSDSVDQVTVAEKAEGISLPLVKQALWGVMTQYERATLQEVDRVAQEVERREQFGKNSSYNSGGSASTRKKSSRETSPRTNELERITQARTAIRSIFAQKDSVAAYQAAIIVFQNSRTASAIKSAARQAVLQGLLQETQALGKAKLTPLRCDVFAAGLDGQRVLVMQWSANKQ